MKIYVIDGLDFFTLDEFFEVIGNLLIPESSWGRNLDALNEILSGGFGTPEIGFLLVWKNSEISRARLGFEETVQQLSRRILKCHPSNREIIQKQLEDAQRNFGATVFEWLVEIIQVHGPNGAESVDNIILRLE